MSGTGRSQAAIRRQNERRRRAALSAQRAAYGLAPLNRYESWYVFDPVAAQQEAAAGGCSVNNPQPTGTMNQSTAGSLSVAAGSAQTKRGVAKAQSSKRKAKAITVSEDDDDDDERYYKASDDETEESEMSKPTSNPAHSRGAGRNSASNNIASENEDSANDHNMDQPLSSNPQAHPTIASMRMDARTGNESPRQVTAQNQQTAPLPLAEPEYHNENGEDGDGEDQEEEEEGYDVPYTITREGMLQLLAMERRNLADRPDELREAVETIKEQMRIRGFLGEGEEL